MKYIEGIIIVSYSCVSTEPGKSWKCLYAWNILQIKQLHIPKSLHFLSKWYLPRIQLDYLYNTYCVQCLLSAFTLMPLMMLLIIFNLLSFAFISFVWKYRPRRYTSKVKGSNSSNIPKPAIIAMPIVQYKRTRATMICSGPDQIRWR